MSDAKLRGQGAASRGVVWVAAVIVGVMVVVLISAVLQASRQPPHMTPVHVSRDRSRKLSDGTILTLEAVTYGKRHHFEPGDSRLAWLRPLLPMLPQEKLAFDESTARDSVVFWMSRRDRSSGRYLAFDWWSDWTVCDEHGCRFTGDGGRNLQALSRNGSSMMEGVTGGGKLSVPSAEYELIVGECSLLAFPRRQKTFRLRLYGEQGRPAAEFFAPNPASDPHPSWLPEPLPITRRYGELSFTLVSLTSEPAKETIIGMAHGTRQTRATFTVAQHGKSTDEWEVRQVLVSDATGNSIGEGYFTRGLSPSFFGLCPYEPAWKLSVKIFRTSQARFAPGELWTVRGVPVPKPGTVKRLSGTSLIQGVTLQLLAIGGKGKFLYSNGVPTPQPVTEDDKRALVWETKSSGIGAGGEDTRWEVLGGQPHVAIRVSGITGDQRLTLRGTDDRQREVFAREYGYGAGTYRCLGLNLLPNAKRVDLTFAVQKARWAEFLVKPPRPPQAKG